MRALAACALAATAGAVLAAPVGAVPVPGPGSARDAEERALVLLGAAARAAGARSYSGTQYVASWSGGRTASALVDIRHQPGRGWDVRSASGATVVAEPTAALDGRMLRLLADHYVLEVSGRGSCSGRSASVVDARRPGREGPGSVAGRFWVDDASDLVLRREVYDASGRAVSSSAFVDVAIGAASASPSSLGASPASLADVPADLPRALPNDLELYDARVRVRNGARVLHLAYSDGLSTLSLFAQRGGAVGDDMDGFTRRRVGSASAWVAEGMPTRVVWAGGGRVWTLVSDAPHSVLRDAMRVLPQDPAPRSGLLARLGRGLARVGAWLNPFA